MKQELSPPRLLDPGHYEEIHRDGDRVLLTIRADWPRLEETSPGLRRINRYYERLAQKLRERWEGELLIRARAERHRGRYPSVLTSPFSPRSFSVSPGLPPRTWAESAPTP